MIVRFRHKGLQLLYEKGDRRRVPSKYAAKLERILARLDQAAGPASMDLPAGLQAPSIEGRSCRLLGGQRVR